MPPHALSPPDRKAMSFQLPDDAPPGRIQARFSTFIDADGKDVIDKQRDIVRRSAFQHLEGTEVPLIWSHEWGSMPVGKGQIHVTRQGAIFDGAFHLQTQYSRDAYETTKALLPLPEFSYGFQIAEGGSKLDERDDGPVRIITKIERVFEVSCVLVGAGEDTGVLALKGHVPEDDEGEKPYANEAACRLQQPSLFQPNSFRRVSRAHQGKAYGVIMGRKKGTTSMSEQAYRYPADVWSAAEARAHCSSHNGQEFSAATGGKSVDAHLDAIGDLLTSVDSELRDLIYEHLEAVVREIDVSQAPDGEAELHAEWTTSYINNLPDSAFAYVESGGTKD